MAIEETQLRNMNEMGSKQKNKQVQVILGAPQWQVRQTSVSRDKNTDILS